VADYIECKQEDLLDAANASDEVNL